MIFKSKIYISSIIFGLITLALAGFLIYFLFRDIKNNSQELFNTKKELALIKDRTRKIKNFEKIYKDYQPNLAKIDQLFVDPKNPVDFFLFLEKLAFDLGISMEISPLIPSGKKSEIDSWPSAIFQVSIKGSFSDFLRFFEKLEMSSYLIEIQNLTLKKISEKKIEQEQQYFLGNISAISLIRVFTK